MIKRDCRKGFTLIELLVVMAIILILAGLLTPGLFRAKQQAGKVSCANSLKQCGVALELYSSQNSGTYPTTTGQLATALDDVSVLSCPAGAPGAFPYTWVWPTAGSASNVEVAYCSNGAHGIGTKFVSLYKGGYVKIR